MNSSKSLNLNDTLSMLDEFEDSRKADYSIWGYLYQFDLMFYDMLTDKRENDLFNDFENMSLDVENLIYEAEMIEDYCKQFKLNDKLYIRLAQIKYNARSKAFFYKYNEDALKTLYYMYLKSIILDCEEFDLKCALFYYNESSTSNSVDYSKEIKSKLENLVEEEKTKLEKKLKANEENNEEEELKKDLKKDKVKIDVNEWIASSKDDDTIYSKLKGKNLDERIQYLFYNLSSQDHIDNFIKNILIVKKVPERQILIGEIKDILKEYEYLLSDDYSLSDEIDKRDMLYSLGINFIINEWQSKKEKSERKPIKIEDIKRYIKSLNNSNISINEIINKILIEYFDELFELIEDQVELEDEEYEDEIKICSEEIIRRFDELLYILLDYFKEVLKDKSNRYSFFNTISNSKFKTKEEYNELKPIEEYIEISQARESFIEFCYRLLKIMYWDKYINNNKIDLNQWFKFDDELFIFKRGNLESKSILLSRAEPSRAKTTYKNVKARINRAPKNYIKPKLWYFNKQGKKRGYNNKKSYYINICNIDDNDKNCEIDKLNEDYFYIECMECLNINEINNHKETKHIFNERCVNCGSKKNR